MSESNQITGICEEVINNGKAKGSGVRIAGMKYGVFDPEDQGLDKIAVGTAVSLRYKEADKGGGIVYKNVQGKITTLAEGMAVPDLAPATPATAGSTKSSYRKNGEAGGFPIHANAYERALDRRNALTNAVAIVETAVIDGDFSTEKDCVDLVLRMARQFEAYTTGDLEADAEATLAFNENTID